MTHAGARGFAFSNGRCCANRSSRQFSGKICEFNPAPISSLPNRLNSHDKESCRGCPASGRGFRENLLDEFDDPSRSVEFASLLGPITALWYRQLASTIYRNAFHAHRILDLGTGPGYLLDPLCRRYPNTSIVGIDRSRAMLDLARTTKRPADSEARIQFVQASFYALPFREHAFDLVTATGILHHADDLYLLFREVRRVLAPGGRFVACAFRRDVSPLVRMLAQGHSAWKRYCGSSLKGFYWVLRASWTKAEIEDAFSHAGFSSFVVQTGIARLATVALA